MNFSLSEQQVAKYLEWLKTRPEANEGAIGGRYTFEFTNTSIGQVQRVTDSVTKESLDLTDYSEW